MTRHAVVILLLLAFVGWTIANDPGIPGARPAVVVATGTADWPAIVAHNATVCAGYVRAYYTAEACCRRGRVVYLPGVYR